MSIFMLAVSLVTTLSILIMSLFTHRRIRRGIETEAEGKASGNINADNNSKFYIFLFIWFVVFILANNVLEDREWVKHFDWEKESGLISLIGLSVIFFYSGVKNTLSIDTSLTNKKTLIAINAISMCSVLALHVTISGLRNWA